MRPCLLHVCLIAVSPSLAVPVADAAPPDPAQAFDTADMHVEKYATAAATDRGAAVAAHAATAATSSAALSASPTDRRIAR